LHELINSQEIIVTDEILKISQELDQLTVNHIMQTENQVKTKHDYKHHYKENVMENVYLHWK